MFGISDFLKQFQKTFVFISYSGFIVPAALTNQINKRCQALTIFGNDPYC